MKSSSIFLVLFCSALLLMAGHSARSEDLQGGIQFVVGLPQGEFKDNVNRNGYGISGQFGYAPVRAPFMVGLELSYLNYGSERRAEPFSTTIPDVTVDVENSNNILLAHLALRLQPNTGFFRPYAEGVVGLNYLFTTTQIQNRGSGGGEVASSTNQSDVAFSYGGGGGLMFLVYENPDQDGIMEVLVDVKGRYLMGGEAEYLKEGSIRRENGRVLYDKLRSKTDLITIHIGVEVRF